MSIEKESKNFDYEKIESSINQYHDIWFGNGYVNRYELDDYTEFKDPFEMIDYIKEEGSDEEKYAIGVFEETMLQNPIGYQYVSRLEKKDAEKYNQIIWKNSKDFFWYTKEGQNVLSAYASSEGISKESSISSILVKDILDQYLEAYERLTNGKEREEVLETLGSTLLPYFPRHIYAHLGFWSKSENVYALHRYQLSGESLPIEVVETKQSEYLLSSEEDLPKEYSSNPELKNSQYERFISTLELYRIPGFVENKYEEFRNFFLLQLKYPTAKEDLIDGSWGYRGIEILKRIGEFSKDKDSRFNTLSEKFLSNILFDKELYSVVDSLRRYEINLEKSKEKHSKVKEKDLEISVAYKDILDRSFNNPKYISWDWFKKEGSNILRSMYEYTPYMYMDIVKRYVDMYCFDSNLTEQESGDIRKILLTLFHLNVKESNELLYKGYTDLKDSKKHIKGEKAIDFLFGKEDGDIRIEENLEFFKSSEDWVTFFKSNSFNRNLVYLFNNDNELFNIIINSLMKSSPTSKDSNYFDNVRMINIVGKKLQEQYEKGAVTLEDYLGEERQEIERAIVRNAIKLCTPPDVRLTVNVEVDTPEFFKALFEQYLNQYSEIVKKLGDLNLNYDGKSIQIYTENISQELLDSIKALDLKYVIEKDRVLVDIESREDIERKLIGILISPTLFEWREDDKSNDNTQNGRLRTLFFLPQNIDVAYKKNGKVSPFTTTFSIPQKKHFVQNYLQWYLDVKSTSGDLKSLNTVVASWLIGTGLSDMRKDVYKQIEQISKESDRVWKDLEQALAISYEYERFKRLNVLEKFLLAVNIEQLMPLVNEDRFQTSLITASIIKSTLEIAKKESVLKGIMQTSATLQNEFEGTSSISYLAKEKRERVEKALKGLGFTPTDDGLEMFRNIWINFWYLRGFRGESQTLKITSAGIEISNPKRNMYEYEKRKNETQPLARKYEGGQDKIIVSWSQIRDVKETKIDMIPSKDIIIKFFTSLASATGKEKRPEFILDIEQQGPANIILKLPGRDEPLCEIFAIHKPMEFWKLLKDLANLMVDEEASEDALELLKMLEKN